LGVSTNLPGRDGFGQLPVSFIRLLGGTDSRGQSACTMIKPTSHADA
jgi:hypothetical protein